MIFFQTEIRPVFPAITDAEASATDQSIWIVDRYGKEAELFAEPLQFLYDRGAAIDMQANNGVTALFIASSSGYTEVVATLLAKGTDTKPEFEDGRTAPDVKKRYCSWRCAKHKARK